MRPRERLQPLQPVEHGDFEDVVHREHQQVGGDDARDAVFERQGYRDDHEAGGDGGVDDQQRALVIGHHQQDADAAGGAGDPLCDDERRQEVRVTDERLAEQRHRLDAEDDHGNRESGDADEHQPAGRAVEPRERLAVVLAVERRGDGRHELVDADEREADEAAEQDADGEHRARRPRQQDGDERVEAEPLDGRRDGPGEDGSGVLGVAAVEGAGVRAAQAGAETALAAEPADRGQPRGGRDQRRADGDDEQAVGRQPEARDAELERREADPLCEVQRPDLLQPAQEAGGGLEDDGGREREREHPDVQFERRALVGYRADRRGREVERAAEDDGPGDGEQRTERRHEVPLGVRVGVREVAAQPGAEAAADGDEEVLTASGEDEQPVGARGEAVGEQRREHDGQPALDEDAGDGDDRAVCDPL
ncbi:hypothetical protein [Halosegnis marinus]|uniref:hypothetical protein n=1 Tax=Halosegnis marinus TaxID=3034023 RepID=UPI0036100B32